MYRNIFYCRLCAHKLCVGWVRRTFSHLGNDYEGCSGRLQVAVAVEERETLAPTSISALNHPLATSITMVLPHVFETSATPTPSPHDNHHPGATTTVVHGGIMSKRANIFEQGKPEQPYNESEESGEAPQRATAAQLAARK